jgi:Tol biopolymer transport system component
MRIRQRRMVLIAGSVLVLALTTPASGHTAARSHAATAQQSTDREGRIAFDSCADTCQIFTVNPDGTALRQVTHTKEFAVNPSWSPDGSHIAFQVISPGISSKLFIVLANGKERRLLLTDTTGFSDALPDYTPDGRRIVFTRCRPDPPGGCAIGSVRTDGTDRRAVTHFRRGIRAGADLFPQVSPDGRRVAFTRLDWKGIRSQVWVARIDGAHARPITAARLGAADGHWSPNGTMLYVHAGPPGPYGYAIYRITVNGSHVTQLTSTTWPTGAFYPAPSPTGARVAFSSTRNFPDGCCARLFVMARDGSHQHLIYGGGDAEDADWGTAPLQHGPAVKGDRPADTGSQRASRAQALKWRALVQAPSTLE